MRRILISSIVLCWLASVPRLSAQNVSIEGTILRGVNDPLSKATVELRTDDNASTTLNQMTTEEDGRFVFQNVRPGRYRLVVTRQAYTRPPLPITVAADQPRSGLNLVMTPTGAIYGHVYDGRGEPAGNIEVQALKATYRDGRRLLTPIESVQTDDLGEYRIFWLQPGRYYVRAVHPQAQGFNRRMMGFGSMMMGVGGGNDNAFISNAGAGDHAVGMLEYQPDRESYVPVYFPGTVDDRAANAVDVRPGADLGGVNIALTPVRARHVRGFIVEALTGKPAEYPGLRPGDDVVEFSGNEFKVDPETAAFDIQLLPGPHTLHATGSGGRGTVVVRVGDADIDGLTIPTWPAFDVTGRITVEGQEGKPPNLEALRMTLRRDPPPLVERPMSSSYSVPLADGSFTLEAGVGDFRVNIAPILQLAPTPFSTTLPGALRDAYVKSIRLGNVDVLNGGLHLEKPPQTPLEIVIGTTRGELEGIVENAQAEYSVVLIPDARRRTDLYKTTTTDSSGRFHFDRIPPGSYKVFAWQEVENDVWYDPEFMQTVENRGTPVNVVEGRSATVRVTAASQ